MITAFSEQLLTIDELRARLPALRARETGLKDQIAALDAQAADRDAYLRLAGDPEGFLARLRGSAATATVEDRQRVLRAVVQDILIGPDKLTIRHRIPVREPSSAGGHHDRTDTEGHMRESSLLRWGRGDPALRRVLRQPQDRPGFRVQGRRPVKASILSCRLASAGTSTAAAIIFWPSGLVPRSSSGGTWLRSIVVAGQLLLRNPPTLGNGPPPGASPVLVTGVPQ